MKSLDQAFMSKVEKRRKTQAIPKFNSMGLNETYYGRRWRIWGDCQLLGV